jgi:hypothetical protein
MKFFLIPWKRLKSRMVYPLATLAGIACMASCGSYPSAAKTPPSVLPVADRVAARNDIPFGLIEEFAAELSVWHFNSSEDVGGILADAHRLGIAFTEQELNSILDEDERKRLWRVGAAEFHIGRLYGETAQVVFKVHHYVSLAGLWVDVANAAGTLTERKAYIGIAGGNVKIAARALHQVPANWDCWDVNACEPRPPMRTPAIRLDSEWVSEGDAIAEDLMALSRQNAPDLKRFAQLLERAQTWDIRVCDALENSA